MVLDQRAVSLLPARKAKTGDLWARIATVRNSGWIEVPLDTYERFENRKGRRSLGVQVNRDRDTGRLTFGVVTDVTAACEDSRTAYAKTVRRDTVALDFGLRTLFAADTGDLFGRGFLARLKALDDTVQGIARHWQRSNPKGKLRECRRYRTHVDRVRDYVRTTVCTALNRIVDKLRPGALLVEKLRFRSPELSPRMNRLVQNCGRAVVAAKLKALTETLGVQVEEVDPAYSSQRCSAPGCGYVDRRNRTGERFACLWCGNTMHADVNGARNLEGGRSVPHADDPSAVPRGPRARRAAVLAVSVRRHVERWPRVRSAVPPGRPGRVGPSPDPRLSNPHFGAWAERAARSGAMRESA